MAVGVGSGSAVCNLAAACGSALDAQEGLRDVVRAGVPFNSAFLDCVLGLEDQNVLGFQAVVDRHDAGEEHPHQVKHAVADAGGVDADVLDVEPSDQLLDLLGLVSERLSAPRVLFEDAEFSALFQGRCDHHAAGVIACAAWVVSNPNWAVAEGAVGLGIVVSPQRLVRVALLQVFKRERTLGAVDKFAHEQLIERIIVVFELQLLQVKQVASTGDGVEDGDRLAPLPVRAQCACLESLVSGPFLAGGSFLLPLAVAE